MENIKLVFSEKLKSARIMAGLSMEGLAKRLDGVITKQSIGKYEAAQMLPNSDIIVKLANVLNVNPNYFFEKPTVPLQEFAFRKKAKMSKKEVNSILAKSGDYLERYLEIENLLGISHAFVDPGEHLISHSKDAELYAEQVRKVWGLGNAPIANLVALLESKGIKVIELETDENFDGLCSHGENFYLIAVNKNMKIVRKRFSMAHELGHLLLKVDKNLSAKEIEKLCNRFAGAFLLPKKSIQNELGMNRKKLAMSELISLKQTFGISIQAILYRAKDLDIMHESSFRSANIYLRKNNLHKNEPGEFINPQSIPRFQQLIDHATAENIITFSKAAYLSGKSIDSYREGIQIL